MDLQLERKRHFLHPSPEADGEGAGASTKGYRNVPQQNMLPTSSPLLGSDAAATGTSLQRHLQLKWGYSTVSYSGSSV